MSLRRLGISYISFIGFAHLHFEGAIHTLPLENGTFAKIIKLDTFRKTGLFFLPLGRRVQRPLQTLILSMVIIHFY